MRGLRLYVRPIESGDHEDLSTFLDRNRERSDEPSIPPFEHRLSIERAPACGLLGKLLGDIVAVVSLEIAAESLQVEEVLVARELRRKWIGRVMMREVELLAEKMERRLIVVENARDAEEFFRRTGFEREGEKWVRVVSQP